MMLRLRSGVPAWLLATAISALWSCDEAGVDEAEVADGAGVNERTPKFVPATLTQSIYRVCANDAEPLRFGVTDVQVGLTQLHIDGINVGALSPGSVLGTMDSEALTLAQPGAMRRGARALQLITPAAVGSRKSQKLNISVRVCSVPTLTAEINPNPIGPGGAHAIAQFGPPDRSVLVAINLGDPSRPTLTSWSAWKHVWAVEQPVTVDLPGYRQLPTEHRPAVAVARLSASSDMDESTDALPPLVDRLRVAWRVGTEGEAIDVREITLRQDGSTVGQRQRAVVRADLAETSAEWAAVAEPAFIDDTLLTLWRAHADVERPLPGERGLLVSRWRRGQERPDAPEVLRLAERQDIDQVGSALDPRALELHHPVPLSVRVGGRAGLIRRDPLTGAIRVTPLHAEEPGFEGDLVNMITVVGGLWSRTTVGLFADGSVRLRLVDVGGRNLPRLRTVEAEQLPAVPPTGAMTVSLLRGTPIFLVPYGDAAPVWALAGTGDQLEPVPLPELYCDAIEARAMAFGDDPDTVGLACLRAGSVYLGLLHAGDPLSEDRRDD